MSDNGEQELPAISPSPGKGNGNKIQEIYSSSIDGVPNTGKDIRGANDDDDGDVEGYAFGKQPVQPIDEEAEPINDDSKPTRNVSINKEDNTGFKNAGDDSMFDDDKALMDKDGNY